MNSPGLRKGASTMKHATTSKKSMFSPARKSVKHPQASQATATKKEKNQEEEKGLVSPTSLQMAGTFIIKNADPSFDSYYHMMKKRKAGGQDMSMTLGNATLSSKFGFVKGRAPTARDGHSSTVDRNRGDMYVFGGDRHHMPFNDLYVLPLQ